MATTVTVKPLAFEDPAWAVAQAKPGEDVGLSVTARNLEAGLEVWFEISGPGGKIDVVKGKVEDEQGKATWKAPNPAGTAQFKFDAVLRQIPTPANGHLTVRRRLTSGQLTVQGYRASLGATDAAFVPKQEKLSAKVSVTDAGGAAKAGRYEIWGERYPSDKPLYTEDFTPAAGDTTWNTWDGKANDGVLNGKYISPEFSPYRLRVIIGPDADAVKDPHGKGKGRVSIAETQFEVAFQSLRVRLQDGLEAAVQTALASALAIEPRQPNGTFAATGRLPAETEQGRIRLPSVRYNVIGESLNQGVTDLTPPPAPASTWQHRVQDPYMDGGGQTKFQIDRPIYTRPELPIEIEPRLRSRDAAKNAAPHLGVFEKEAVGPAIFDVYADDAYGDTLYTAGTPEATYLSNAATRIKRGTHNVPYQSGGNPQITYWQQRFVIAADGDRDLNTTLPYTTGQGELTVYLNRGRLTAGADADYTEPGANQIKLRAGLTRAGDVVWVMRIPSAAHGAAVANWSRFPPGDNTHARYGGLRGAAAPNPALRDAFSAAPAGTEPILGKGAAAFPYTAQIKLDPDGAGDARERATAQAAPSGAKQGLAGVLFSPSVIGGDSYRVEIIAPPCPYARELGFVAARAAPAAAGAAAPLKTARTGVMTVWRVCSITNSQKLPAPGTNGLSAGVGIADAPLAGRANPGDGTGMNVARLNTLADHAFNEWEVPVPAAPVAPGEPHRDVNLATYRATHNGQAGTFGAGHVNLANNAAVTSEIVPWDHYRVRLPPGIPANRRNAVSNAIAGLAAGTAPSAAAAAAQAAITALAAGAADPALAGGAAAIPLPAAGTSSAAYHAWVKRIVRAAADAQLDALTPQVNPPRSMSTLRWPNMYHRIWHVGTPGAMNTQSIGTAGYCRGNGQSFFATVGGNPDTFEHEMGHSVHICHFSTGSTANSCWKHHDHGYPQCIMGYYNQAYAVPLPGGATGPAININTGARNLFCAKCLLKMRGWNEEVLPCNWTHPDVY